MELEPVLEHIDQHLDETVETLIDYCREETISAEGRDVSGMVRRLEETLSGMGAIVSRYEAEARNPIVFGDFTGATKRRVILYNHYDVQPPGNLSEWTTSPFTPTIRDGVLFARGAADNKGSLVARLAALRAFYEIAGQPPVEVGYLIEGEEESGSRLLRDFVPANAARLAADGLIWEEASSDQFGRPVMRLGNKGMLQVELTATGPRSEVHSRFAGIMPNPLWKLIWAMATIRDPDGRVTMDGFLEDVAPPTPEEDEIYAALAEGTDTLLSRNGLSRPFPTAEPHDTMRTLYHAPTCNITGMSGGYVGPGHKSILPATASLRLEFRLVPHQSPDRVLEILRSHLKRQGFGELGLRVINALPPSKTPLHDPFVELVRDTGQVVYGTPLAIEPSSSGSGPRHVFASVIDVPIVAIGASHAASMIHGANENIRIEDLRSHARHIATMLHGLANL